MIAVEKWLEWYYGKFVGCTCLKAEVRDDGKPVLIFKHPDGGTLEMELPWTNEEQKGSQEYVDARKTND